MTTLHLRKSNIKFYWFAVIFGCGLMLITLGAASAQQPIRPTAVINVGPAQEINAQPNFVMAQPHAPVAIPFRSTMGQSAYEAAKQRANSAFAPGATRPAPLAPLGPPTVIINNFTGHSTTEGLRPPDTHGAVGLNNFVEVTNSHFDVWTKGSSPTLVKSVTLATFFNYTAQTLFDPRVVYDPTWQRWIVTADAFAESTTVQRLFIGISKTNNPTGAFFIYNVNVDFKKNNDFYDFPQLGIDQDAVLFTGNIFQNGGAGAFVGADFFSVAKARLYNGLGFSVPVFTGLVGTLAPPIVRDQNASTFLIAAPESGTTFTKYTATNTSHPLSTHLVPSTVTVSSYGVPPSAQQPRTTQLLDTSDSRFVNASTQNGTDLWQTHTINDGGFPTPFFYRINTSTNAITQSGFYFASRTSDDFNASITANTAGNCFVTWSSTDPNVGVNAQVRLSGKLNADTGITAGTPGFTSTTFLTGNFDSNFGTQRWGDYSAVTVDPSNANTAWLVNEKIDSNSIWGSRIITIGF